MASAKAIGYPCMVQPSMREDKRQIVYWPEELGAFLSRTVVSKEFPMMVIEILAGAQVCALSNPRGVYQGSFCFAVDPVEQYQIH